MLRRTTVACETWRSHYHRLRIPRHAALKQHVEKLERQKAKAAGAAAAAPRDESYKYNRFFVNEKHELVVQEAVVEDPDVIAERRSKLPAPTAEDVWRTPQRPYFEPMLPFVRVLDYTKDPDVKFLKPTNIPRWKDFMMRSKPMIPRTWY